jgi:hypothetical protein
VRRNIPVTNRKALDLSLNVDKTCAEYFNGLMEKLKKKGRTKERRRVSERGVERGRKKLRVCTIH